MYVEKRDNGKYRFGEWYTEYRTGKRRRATVTLDRNTAASRREAEKLLAAKIAAANAEASPDGLTLSGAIDAYISHQAGTLKQTTVRRNRCDLGKVASILGPDTRLSSLTAGYVNRRMLASGRSKATINEDMARFKAFMRWCYRQDMAADIGWLDKIERYKVEKAPERAKYLERHELKKLLPELKVPVNRLLIEFLALSGLRVGEALALTWTDIDGDSIHVTKTYDHSGGTVTSTKTAASARTVHIQPELADVLERLRAFYKKAGVLSVIVFVDTDGKRLGVRAVEKYFSENCERVLGRRMKVHSLRHTHASLLFERGVGLEAVSLRLGHADSRVTREIYLHITEKKKEEYDRQLDGVSILG